MSTSSQQLAHSLRELRSRGAIRLLRDLYNRAPASVGTLGGLLLTWIVQRTWEDYRLWYSLGPGGLFPRSFWGYMLHQLFVVPLSLPSQICRSSDHDFLPPEHRGSEPSYLTWMANKRRGERPVTKGCAPHRCVNQRVISNGSEGGEKSRAVEAITSHLTQIQVTHPTLLSLGPSILENHSSPALFHTPSAIALGPGAPSPLATFYTSLLPLREFAHYHNDSEADGSLHLILSPADARIVIQYGWGELHPLAGFGLSGYWFPFLSPGWRLLNYPLRLLQVGLGLRAAGKGGEERTRWGRYPPVLSRNVDVESTRRSKGGGRATTKRRAMRLPPTYMLIYPPTMRGRSKQEGEAGTSETSEEEEDEVETVKRIIDASASFVLGFNVQRHRRPEGASETW
ncbi:hypothetical protein BCV69DRAFT_312429 [Microstroma glucosiphilum]|uniref:Luciferase domain-containing protein n=1 Tax=Pseudomicrostroma glucosiphilum TaxID=1684307 RepID=A0A316U7F5_9BASI|nr:hypothetical protein BCV69DRAFT_312429 [Pseudomicrostroma glucosiphilum]PWN21176.1 hypothetical protein BCV69DRAFT_312429 [Pseudomicrostroma glucosiphilum]